ncbi:hypothetical protein PanWU01x14_145700, partial [Parasponia andersonii]
AWPAANSGSSKGGLKTHTVGQIFCRIKPLWLSSVRGWLDLDHYSFDLFLFSSICPLLARFGVGFPPWISHLRPHVSVRMGASALLSLCLSCPAPSSCSAF